MKSVVPEPGLVITGDVRFEPGVHEFHSSEPIAIAADDIEIDGNGAILQAVTRGPELPDGDFLYTPGDMGITTEPHELISKVIGLDVRPASATPTFEYRYWGPDNDSAEVSVSVDGETWHRVSRVKTQTIDGDWKLRRYGIDSELISENGANRFQIRLVVPTESVSHESPCFYDAFRMIIGGTEVWRGDARENWQAWHNIGFSIFKRSEKSFYRGTAIRAVGRKGVKLVNVSARGFLTGMHLADCRGWTIEGLDLSDNYTDPDYGWGDGVERYGAFYLENVHDSRLISNSATGVWNGISLRRCTGLEIEKNSIHHCSNTCLKMIQSSRNTIRDNDLSWGIRIYQPEEVHARDSVSLLVESGSNDNSFLRNDFSHGGDGVFIRVLNSWCSTGNVFEENDCSDANNNAIEAWSPGNVYRNNKANRSSYGIWLGGSDDTVLIGNEVKDNGKSFQNAPEPFGNAGISVVHGPSSGFIVTGNTIEDNNGPGISFANRADAPAREWLIVGNKIRNNRNDPRGYPGHGVFAEYCRRVRIYGNAVEGNEGTPFVLGRSCNDIRIDERKLEPVCDLGIETDGVTTAGEEIHMRLIGNDSRRELDNGDARFSTVEWDFGDDEDDPAPARPGAGESSQLIHGGSEVSHVYWRPGRNRVSAIADGEGACGGAWKLVYILPEGRLIADGSSLEGWEIAGSNRTSQEVLLELDRQESVRGDGSIVLTARNSGISTLRYSFDTPIDLSSSSGLSFFYRYGSELFIHTGKCNRIIRVRLVSGQGDDTPIPGDARTGDRSHEESGEPPDNRGMQHVHRWYAEDAPSEDRYAWVYHQVPWHEFEIAESFDLEAVSGIEIDIGPDEPADYFFRIDGIFALAPAPRKHSSEPTQMQETV